MDTENTKSAKTIIVTGASSGIGRALSEHLAALHHYVIAVARRAEELEKLMQLYPDRIKPVVADISGKEGRLSIKHAVNGLNAIYLVHNAGIAFPQFIAELSEDEWDRHYAINVKGPLFLTQLLLPNLENGGRVLHVSTGLAHSTLPGMSAYGTSKAAFYLFKEFCNTELGNKNIYFASAMPGIVDTPIQEHLRGYSKEVFPAAGIFMDFFQHGKLLHPSISAKFLSWLLLSVDNERYVNGEWDINDPSHHADWAV